MKNIVSKRNTDKLVIVCLDHEKERKKMLLWKSVYVCVIVWEKQKKQRQRERESKKAWHKEPVCAAPDCPSYWSLRAHSEWQWTTALFFRLTGWRPSTSPLLISILWAPPAQRTAQPHSATASTAHSMRILFVKISNQPVCEWNGSVRATWGAGKLSRSPADRQTQLGRE